MANKPYKKRAKPLIGKKLKKLQTKARQTAKKHIKELANPLKTEEKPAFQEPAPIKPPPPEAPKEYREATEAQYEDRLTATISRLIEGCRRREIIAYANKKAWGISHEQIDSYIRDAKKILMEEHQIAREEKIARNDARLDKIYRECMILKNMPFALGAIKEQNRMYGIGDNQTQNVKLSADKAVLDKLAEIAQASRQYINSFSGDPNKDLSYLEEHEAPTHTPDQLQ